MSVQNLHPVDDALIGELCNFYQSQRRFVGSIAQNLKVGSSRDLDAVISEYLVDARARLAQLRQQCAGLGIAAECDGDCADSRMPARRTRRTQPHEQQRKRYPKRTDCRYDDSRPLRRNRSLELETRGAEPAWLYAAR